MKNKILDLNNHLFTQLERLSDEDLKGDELKQELERAKQVANVSREIINTGKLALEAQKAFGLGDIKQVPIMLESDSK